MIKKETVFVLGAGASVPYLYPTMNGLRRYILNDFKKEATFTFKNDLSMPSDIFLGKIEGFRKRYEAAGKLSIDEYLSICDNPNDEKLGLLAISMGIAKHERESKTGNELENFLIAKSERETDYNYIDEDWYSELHRILIRPITHGSETIEDFGKNLSIVTFNYDRSLENFLYTSLIQTFPKISVEKQINQIPIVHMYGQIMPLPWQNQGIPYTEYKKIKNAIQLNECAKNIRIMSQSRPQDENINQAQEIIKKAKRVFILGFGFDEYNCEMLGFPETIDKENHIYHTQRNIGDDSLERIEELYSFTDPYRVASTQRSYSNIREVIRDKLMAVDKKAERPVVKTAQR